MMKIGLTTAILPDLTFEQVTDFAAGVGYKCLEVCCWPKGRADRRYSGITHIDLDSADGAKLLYYRDYALERGVSISSLGYYPNPMDGDKTAADAAVAHIYKLIDASAKMDVNMITTFVGKDKTKTVEDNLELYVKVWTPIVRYAEDAGVKIAIENCPMLYSKDEWPGGTNLASTPYIWRQMFSLIKSDNLGLNYDAAHPYLLGMDYIQPVYDFKDKLFHIHLKDIKIHRDKLDMYGMLSYPGLWHSPKLPGLGGVNFGALISALGDVRYEGACSIEVEDRAYEATLDDVKSGIAQSYRYVSQYI